MQQFRFRLRPNYLTTRKKDISNSKFGPLLYYDKTILSFNNTFIALWQFVHSCPVHVFVIEMSFQSGPIPG